MTDENKTPDEGALENGSNPTMQDPGWRNEAANGPVTKQDPGWRNEAANGPATKQDPGWRNGEDNVTKQDKGWRDHQRLPRQEQPQHRCSEVCTGEGVESAG